MKARNNNLVDDRSPETLARGAREGSPGCFDALVELLGPRLLKYLCRRVGDLHTAEDLAQETFLKAYRNLNRYDPSRSFAPWLFTIATRLAASQARSHRLPVTLNETTPLDSTQTDPAEIFARAQQHENLWDQATRNLSEDQFSALWLRYAEEMSVAQIAAVMGKTRTGVKVLLYRARQRLICLTFPTGVRGVAAAESVGKFLV